MGARWGERMTVRGRHRMISFMRLIQGFQDDLERGQARALRLLFSGLVIAWLAIVSVFACSVLPTYDRNWPDLFTGQYSAVTSNMLGDIGFMLLPLLALAVTSLLGMAPYVAWFAPTQRSTTAFAHALIRAVEARDPAVVYELSSATVASPQDGEQAPITLAPISRPLDAGQEVRGKESLYGGLIAACLFGVFTLIAAPDLLSHSGWPFIAMISGGAIGLAALGVISLRFYHLGRTGSRVTVDNTGLSVHMRAGWRRERRILWSDMRGFARFVYYYKTAVPSYVYILSATTGRFIWEEPAIISEEASVEGQLIWERRKAARRLAALVQRNTSLPLLDISHALNAAAGGQSLDVPGYQWSVAERALPIAKQMGDQALTRDLLARLRPAGSLSRMPRGLARWRIWRSVRSIGAAERQNLLDLAHALLPYYLYPATPDAPVRQPAIRILTGLGLVLQWLALLAVVAVCLFPFTDNLVIAGLNPIYSQPLLAGLPARVQRETPIFASALDTPAYGWVTRSATHDDPRSARFTTHGYELALPNATGQNTRVNAVWNGAIRVPAESAVEVTVWVDGPTSINDPQSVESDAGLILAPNVDGSSGIAFSVESAGAWGAMGCVHLDRAQADCAELSVVHAENSWLAPNNGDSPTYTLLLIHHGRTYLFYTNGQFLASYHDEVANPAPSDALGFFLDSGGTMARFTNLTVYPVPQGMPFWAW
jgi:hypothetical protein